MRSLTKGKRVSNLLTSGISRSIHPKLRSSQLEWWEKIPENHNKKEDHSNAGNVEEPTCTGIVHLRMRMKFQLTTFKRKKQWVKQQGLSLGFMQHQRTAKQITSQLWLNLQVILLSNLFLFWLNQVLLIFTLPLEQWIFVLLRK